MSSSESKPRDMRIDGEVYSETMAAYLSSQIALTFCKLVEAGADEAALSFYRQALTLNELYQLAPNHPINSTSTLHPTVEELVDL